MTYTLHTGDCRDVMATMPAESVDAIVCDPPYGLSFMGKGWDHGVPGVDFWVEALRVLKPGGHLIAFGGTRTYHRLAVAIEDAGFEVRDCLMWLYGNGFPKSLDVSKAMDKQAGAEREVVSMQKGSLVSAGRENWKNLYDRGDGKTPDGRDFYEIIKRKEKREQEGIAITAPNTDLAKEWHGWGTALKPAYEPAILARKPLRGTVADNVAQWGVGGLNIDGTRIATDDAQYTEGNGNDTPKRSGDIYGFALHERKMTRATPNTTGRWPANVILDEEAAAALDEQSGVTKSSKPNPNVAYGNGERLYNNIYGRGIATSTPYVAPYADTGGASRFFYTAKASRSEREAGLDAPIGERANGHPTIKPIALMRYMIRLVAPRGAVVLDPFMGSGSTGCAAMVEGMQFIGIDITPEYVDIARRRIAWWSCSLDGNAIMNTEENDA